MDTDAYTYLDYWLFYRFNDFSLDEHEGDWEGVTLGVAHSSSGFDFASFAQHTERSTYLRSSLQCDEGGDGSCGTDASPAGTRLRVFVASGSHASYPGPCSSGWIPPTVCGQPGTIPAEANHDGEAAWGRSHDEPLAGAFLRFPAATTTWGTDPASAQWVNWPGHWGVDCAPDFDCLFPSPASPGTQDRFNCPQYGNELDPASCPLPPSRRSAKAQALKKSTPVSKPIPPSACGTWFGADVAATACSPRRLRLSVRDADLGHPGSFAFRSPSRHFRTGSAPGIAQALGQPLRRGERLSLSGTAAAATQLAVRAISGRKLLEATFTQLGLRRGGKAVLSIGGTARHPALVLTRQDGSRAAPRWVTTYKLTSHGTVKLRTPLPRAGKTGSPKPGVKPKRLRGTRPGRYRRNHTRAVRDQ